MSLKIEANKKFIRSIFNGTSTRHGLIYQPPLIPIAEAGDYTISNKPVNNWVSWVVENYMRQARSLELIQDDSIPVASLVTGTQIFANAFGCKIHIPSGERPCALPMVTCWQEAEKLEVPDIWKTRCLYRVFELGHAVRRELGKDVALSPCDIQTGWDIANQIWDKSDMLYAMMLEPDAVKHFSSKCTLLLKTFLMELRKEFPTMSPCHCPGNWTPPELGPWMSEDEIGIISPEMFEKFCLPELNELCVTFGGIGLHCCADAEHQFPEFKKIKNLYGFNRIASKHGYLPLLEHLAGQKGPVHCMAWLSDEVVEQLIAQAPAGTRFIFVHMGADDGTVPLWLTRGLEFSDGVQRNSEKVAITLKED